MTITYKTKGTCSTRMHIEVENDTVQSLVVDNGCNGNLTGISKLVVGMRVDDVIEKLKGIRCGGKPTSCPDQLAKALMESKA